MRPLFIFLPEDKAISKESLINEEIRAKEVRLIDAEGTQVGIVPIQEALAKAAEANLDLVNISPNAAPPVCRIMDYGKYRYEQQKKEKEARKKQKRVAKFLEGGDKVKISMRFRGREMGYVKKGEETMLNFAGLFAELGNLERAPKLEGRNMSMTIAPKSEREKEKIAKAKKQAAEKAAAENAPEE